MPTAARWLASTPVDKLAVDDRSAGMRLDVFVTKRVAPQRAQHGLSRSAIQRLLHEGRLTLNGARVKPSARVKAGDVVEIRWSPPTPATLSAEPLPLNVLYEDEDCIVIDKPPGMVVHPAAGHEQGTLVNALLHAFPEIEGIGGARRPGIVHRLDKDTSGIMIIAKNGYAYQQLAAQFNSRTVMKEYLAFVWGKMPAAEGVIDRPIGRHRSDRKRMSSLPALSKARQALTRWQVASCFGLKGAAGSWRWVSLLTVKPETGRTHQIRVHLADSGHSLIGDKVYGRKRGRQPGATAVDFFPRQALHAKQLVVNHPRTGKRMNFCAPVPDDMRQLLEDLRPARLAPFEQIAIDNKT